MNRYIKHCCLFEVLISLLCLVLDLKKVPKISLNLRFLFIWDVSWWTIGRRRRSHSSEYFWSFVRTCVFGYVMNLFMYCLHPRKFNYLWELATRKYAYPPKGFILWTPYTRAFQIYNRDNRSEFFRWRIFKIIRRFHGITGLFIHLHPH